MKSKIRHWLIEKVHIEEKKGCQLATKKNIPNEKVTIFFVNVIVSS
jgi:hypothetical protein